MNIIRHNHIETRCLLYLSFCSVTCCLCRKIYIICIYTYINSAIIPCYNSNVWFANVRSNSPLSTRDRSIVRGCLQVERGWRESGPNASPFSTGHLSTNPVNWFRSCDIIRQDQSINGQFLVSSCVQSLVKIRIHTMQFTDGRRNIVFHFHSTGQGPLWLLIRAPAQRNVVAVS